MDGKNAAKATVSSLRELAIRAIGLLPGMTTDRAENVTRGNVVKHVTLGGAVVAITVLTVVPLVFLLWSSLWSAFPGDFSGSFTLENFELVYLERVYDVTGLFANSLFIAVGMTLIAMTFGLGFAWLFVRTDLPTRGAMELVIVSPYAVPGYIYAIMYIATYGPKSGLVTSALNWVPGVQALSSHLFTGWGIAFVVGINAVTSFYLLTAPALQQMDPKLEEMSRIHGAGIFRTLRSISFPLVVPAILAAITVTFLRGLGEFSVVAILGAPEGFDVYATAIWSAVSLRAPPEYGLAAALSFSLIAVTAVLTWYYRSVTSRKEDYMTVTGRSYRPKKWELGRWRWPLALSIWGVLFFVWILPVLVMVLVSFHSFWTGIPTLSELTIAHYLEAVTDRNVRRAFLNSIAISLGGATLGTALVVAVAYYTERTEYRGRGVVDFLCLSPLAVPGIIMGTAVIFTGLWVGKVHPIFDLYGTLWIIMIGCIIVFIPYSSRIAIGNVVQIHDELEESARLFGASWLQGMREVFLPLFRNTAAVIWFYLLIHIFQLLTIPIMTYTSGTEVIAIEVFHLWMKEANLELVSALSTLFIGMTFCILLGLRRIGISFHDLQRR